MPAQTTTAPTQAPGGATTGSATVTGTGGGGLRCRASASYSGAVIVVLPEAGRVALRGGAQGEWQPVVCASQNGFAHASFLSSGGATAPRPTATVAPTRVATAAPTTAPAPAGLRAGSRARVDSALNLRYQASYGAGIAAVAPAGTVVLIKGGPTNGFYQVDWDGLGGYMHGDYLTGTTAALTERGGSGSAPAPGATAPPPTSGGGGSAVGSQMSSFALRYQGYPYVWATAGPSSFDCSGFTYWVTKNVTGADIGRGLFTQVAAGTPVSRANLQPGDLVFFQNTYTWGLSHSGVYIGNNQFIHAENETTGVKISDLNSTYYSTRWYGARRMG
jgi:cell wall-associated NlpC family hydrolase